LTVNYATSLKITRMQSVIDAIDANASPAYIEIGTSGMVTILVTITLDDPSFVEGGGVITMAGVPKTGTASADGLAASARIKDGGGNIIVSGLTVGESGTEVVLLDANIINGQPVTLNSGSITHG
jgi:hypothetical protein